MFKGACIIENDRIMVLDMEKVGNDRVYFQ